MSLLIHKFTRSLTLLVHQAWHNQSQNVQYKSLISQMLAFGKSKMNSIIQIFQFFQCTLQSLKAKVKLNVGQKSERFIYLFI